MSESAHGVAASENAERENMDAQKKRRSPRLYGGQGQIGTPTCQPERLLSNTAAKKVESQFSDFIDNRSFPNDLDRYL